MSRPISTILAALVMAALLSACADPDPGLGGRSALGVGEADAATVTTPDDAAPTDTTALPATTSTTVAAGAPPAGVVTVPAGGAPLSTEPGGPPFIQIHENVVMGFLNRSGEWLEVTTMCNETAWVAESDVVVTPQATAGTVGPGFDIAEAVIVVDPGHGDRDWGGVGPNGLGEKTVNLDISEKVRVLMEAPQSVDWATGAITPGSDVPAFGKVWLTRDRSGPNDGDFELGLAFRAEFANAAGANVFVSVHNNTVPRIDTEIPGSEVFYAKSVPDSDRLAALIYEELLRSFAVFEADWTGGEILGARNRYDPATDDDYYGLMRRATMPAVIVEGVYIDQPDQEALLETDEFRQAYAEAIYRGVVRFLTTDETFDAINPPEPFPDDAGTVNTSACQLPAQP